MNVQRGWIAAAAALAAALLPQAGRADPPPLLPALHAQPLPLPGDLATRTFPGGVRMYGDITYAERVGYRPLKLDLYLPPHRHGAGPLPLVVWFHGGGYEVGNPRADWTYGDWSAVLARLAARGYAVAGVTYRFRREAAWPAQFDDGRDAVSFLRGHADRWHIDGTRVYAWGLSAGAHLAAMLAMKGTAAQPQWRVQGVAEWFGPTDLTTFDRPEGPASTAALLGCAPTGCLHDTQEAASPVAYVSPAAPPVLIVHGVRDHLVPIAQGDAFAARLQQAGVDVTYRRLEGLDHGFEGGTSAQQDAILLDTFAFFDRLSKASGSLRSSGR